MIIYILINYKKIYMIKIKTN